MLFGKNTITGRAKAFNRDENGELVVTLDLGTDGSISLLLNDELANEVERVLFNRRQERRPVTLTLEYDSATGRVVNYSIIS